MNEKLNPHQGSAFDDFLKSEGIYEEAMASPKVKRAFKDLADSIEAGQHEAFAAGWNAFLATHSVLLITHCIRDFPHRLRTSLDQVLGKAERIKSRAFDQ